MSTRSENEPTPHQQNNNDLSACCWALVTEAAFGVIGAIIGVIVYLPGPLDGWLYFHMIVFGIGGLLLGLPASILSLMYFARN